MGVESSHNSGVHAIRLAKSPLAGGAFHQHRVLIIDDQTLSGRATSRFVRARLGCGAYLARTWHQAECYVRFGPKPSAIVSDFELEGEDHGVHLLQHLRWWSSAPAAILTGSPVAAEVALAGAPFRGGVRVLTRGAEQSLEAWLRDALGGGLDSDSADACSAGVVNL